VENKVRQFEKQGFRSKQYLALVDQKLNSLELSRLVGLKNEVQ
jgi:hypothetical protein